MAKPLSDTPSQAPTRRPPRPLRSTRLVMSPPHLQAYLLARETLRRLKCSSRPCFAREPSPAATATKTTTKAASRPDGR
ncbi:hypothetical protein SAMN05428960_1856 [Mitsuaria sp. PDC51]|uniref:hypothetical protein n=1 Tax=Mitsuaria sp. PDC51 TaxID=1881035 RepID=UPI0008E9F9C9|nr:hypothetical protein [Mitsuaria sp. PDC51]SFR79743.1 hypothetical protein SAMN05428960_1856 [Mitsuaria sp. PDC51]